MSTASSGAPRQAEHLKAQRTAVVLHGCPRNGDLSQLLSAGSTFQALTVQEGALFIGSQPARSCWRCAEATPCDSASCVGVAPRGSAGFAVHLERGERERDCAGLVVAFAASKKRALSSAVRSRDWELGVYVLWRSGSGPRDLLESFAEAESLSPEFSLLTHGSEQDTLRMEFQISAYGLFRNEHTGLDSFSVLQSTS